MMVFNTIFFQSAKSGETGIDKQAVKFSNSNYLFADIIDVVVDSSEVEVQESSATAGNESQYLAFAFDIGKGLPSEAVEFYNSVLRIFPKMSGNAQLSNGNSNGNLKSESVILKKEDLNAFLAPLFDELSPINVAPKQDASVPVSLFEVAGTLVLEKAESANLVLALDQHGGDDRLIIINPLSKADQRSILPGSSASEEYYLVSLVPSPIAIEDTPSIADLVHGFALPFDMETVQSLSAGDGAKLLHNPYAENPTEEEKKISELITVFNATASIPVYTYNIIKNTPVTDVDAALGKDWDNGTIVSQASDTKTEHILNNLKQLFSELFTQTRGEMNLSTTGIAEGASLVMKTQEVMTLLEGLIRSGELTLAGSDGKMTGNDLIASLRYLSYTEGGENQKLISIQPLNISSKGETDSFQVRFYTLTGDQNVEQVVARLKLGITSDSGTSLPISEKVGTGKEPLVQETTKQTIHTDTSAVQKMTSMIREQLAALNQITEIDDVSMNKTYPSVWKEQEKVTAVSSKAVDVDKMLSDFFSSEKNMKMVFPTGKTQLDNAITSDGKTLTQKDVRVTGHIYASGTHNSENPESILTRMSGEGKVVLSESGTEDKGTVIDKIFTDPVIKTGEKTESGLPLHVGNNEKEIKASAAGRTTIPVTNGGDENSKKSDTKLTENMSSGKTVDTRQYSDGKTIVAKNNPDTIGDSEAVKPEQTGKVLDMVNSHNETSDHDSIDNAKQIISKDPDLRTVIQNKGETGVPKPETFSETHAVPLKEDKNTGLKTIIEPKAGNKALSDKKVHTDQVLNFKSEENRSTGSSDTRRLPESETSVIEIESSLRKSIPEGTTNSAKTEILDNKTVLISGVDIKDIPLIKEKVVEAVKGKETAVVIVKRGDPVVLPDIIHENETTLASNGMKDTPGNDVLRANDATGKEAKLNTIPAVPVVVSEPVLVEGTTDDVQKALSEFAKLNQVVAEDGIKQVKNAPLPDTSRTVKDGSVVVHHADEKLFIEKTVEIKDTLISGDNIRIDSGKPTDSSNTVVLITEAEELIPDTIRSAAHPGYEKKIVVDTEVPDSQISDRKPDSSVRMDKSEVTLTKLPDQKAVTVAVKVAQIIETVIRNNDEKPIIVAADTEEYGKVIITASKENGMQEIEVVINNPVLKKLVTQVITAKNDDLKVPVDADQELSEITVQPQSKKEGKNIFAETSKDGFNLAEPIIVKRKSAPVPEDKSPYDDMVTFVKVKSQVHHISGSGRVDEMMYAEAAENRPVTDLKTVKQNQTDVDTNETDESQTILHTANTLKPVQDYTQQHQSGDNAKQGTTYHGQTFSGQSEFSESGTFSSELNQMAGAARTAMKPGVPVTTEKVVRDTEVFKEVSRFIARREKSEMILRVEPENLGKVKIRLVMQQDQMRAQIEVESDAVKKMLESNLPQLFRDAGQAGVQLGAVQISLTQQESRQTKQGNPRKRNAEKVADTNLDDNKEMKAQKRMGYNTYEYLA